MSLQIGGTSTNGRAIHLNVVNDIADLSLYGIGIANNGGGSDGREIDLPSGAYSAGDQILIVRDVDRAGLETYFGATCFANYALVFETPSVNFNGDDAVELFQGSVSIETYGDVVPDGTGEPWEYTGSWAYKLAGEFVYGGVGCSSGAGNTGVDVSDCPYPLCGEALQIQGVSALLWDGSGVNGGKFVHLRAYADIPDLSIYGIGVANNGGGTDGEEITFAAQSAAEGDDILIVREPETLSGYFGLCYDDFDIVVQSDGMNQNGDDAIELFKNGGVIETYGDVNVDGTGQFWDYAGSWGYKTSFSEYSYGGVDCAAASTTTQGSACAYPLCD